MRKWIKKMVHGQLRPTFHVWRFFRVRKGQRCGLPPSKECLKIGFWHGIIFNRGYFPAGRHDQFFFVPIHWNWRDVTPSRFLHFIMNRRGRGRNAVGEVQFARWEKIGCVMGGNLGAGITQLVGSKLDAGLEPPEGGGPPSERPWFSNCKSSKKNTASDPRKWTEAAKCRIREIYIYILWLGGKEPTRCEGGTRDNKKIIEHGRKIHGALPRCCSSGKKNANLIENSASKYYVKRKKF